MPALLAMLLGGLIQITGSIAGRVLVALGISVVTYTGMNASLEWLKTQAVSAMAGAGGDVLGMLGTMKVGECISIVTSAMIARQVIAGIQNDSVKKWVTK